LRLKKCHNLYPVRQCGFQERQKSAAALAGEIRNAIVKAHKIDPHVAILPQSAFEKAAAANPYPEADADPKSVHLFFLDEKPAAKATAALEKLRAERERFALKGAIMYLHAPDGVGRSKLAAGAEKALAVPATARNWRTVGKLIEMAREL
jgi:uncharacterized protein (DUF1697 family)